ncbi:HD domain-containing protein, partial [Streptomyces nigra]
MTTKTGDVQVSISFGGAVADSAYTHVRGVLDPAILNHSIRVWLVAEHLGRKQGIGDWAREALAVACLFHDTGTAAPYDGPQRFEVEGADAARAFLKD